MNPGELTGVLSRLSTGLLNLSKDPQMNLAFVWRRPTQIKTLITVGIWERGDSEPKYWILKMMSTNLRDME